MSDGKLDLPKEEMKRTNYFTSQFLVEDDFNNEQDYHLEMRRLHNRALHIWGVVDGLVVTKAGPQSVSVSPGMAIDKDGKEILLIQSPAPALTFDKNPPGPGALFVVLSYKDNDQDTKYVYTGTGLPDANKRYTRTVESWELDVVNNAPDDGSVIKLALLKVDANGLVGDPDNTVRRLAGSSIPRGSWLGSQDLCIGADGKVGIGTLTPGEKLQVNGGDLMVKGTDNFTASPHEGRVYLGDNYSYIKAVWGSGVRIGTYSQHDAITLLQDGGKVGIGTIAPGQKLEVAGALKLTTNPSVSNNQSGAYFWDQANVGPTIAGAQFEVRTGGDTPRLRIGANGKVGIGVTNPAALLQAGGTPANTGGATFFNDAIAMLTCRESNVGTIPRNPVLVFAREGSAGASYANFARFDLGTHGGYRTQLDIGLSNEALNSEANNTPVVLSLRSNGNVGIGTQTPGFPLSFSNASGDKISLWGQSGNHYGFGIQSSLLQIHTDSSGADIAFGYGSSGSFTEVMRIKGAGNVGIGATDQNVKLKVDTLGGTIASLKCEHRGSNFTVRPFSSGGNSTVIENTGGGALLINPSSGNVGIGTTAPIGPLSIGNASVDGSDGYLVLGKKNGNYTRQCRVGYDSVSNFVIGDYGNNNTAGTWSPQFAINWAAPSNSLYIDSNGNVGIGTATPQRRLQIGVNGIGFDPSDGSPNIGYIRFGDSTGWKLHFGQASSSGSKVTGLTGIIMTLQDQGYVGVGTTDPKGAGGTSGGKFVVMGNGMYGISIGGSGTMGGKNYAGDSVQGTGNLWLDAANTVYLKPGWRTAGSDLAEIFETSEQVAPGDVVVFDEHDNSAKLCEREGDSCVIGIISTAPAGVLGTGDESTPPIALCGRVPCNVDADIAPICVGDLLTTSPTKGHAQKALDVSRNAGAIIGKALGSLEKGKGQITVLVALA